MSVLWGTFGSDTSCIRRFVERNDKPKTLQIHLLNNTCMRRRCYDGELFRGDYREFNKQVRSLVPKLTRRVQRIRAVVETLRRENVTFILGTGLEDNYTRDAYEVVLDTIRPYWPYWISRNPSHGVSHYLGYADMLEVHGRNAKCGGKVQIANQDGTLFSDSGHKTWFKQTNNCKYRIGWIPELQGRGKNNRFSPPKSREFYISRNQIKRRQQLQ